MKMRGTGKKRGKGGKRVGYPQTSTNPSSQFEGRGQISRTKAGIGKQEGKTGVRGPKEDSIGEGDKGPCDGAEISQERGFGDSQPSDLLSSGKGGDDMVEGRKKEGRALMSG